MPIDSPAIIPKNAEKVFRVSMFCVDKNIVWNVGSISDPAWVESTALASIA